MFTIIALSILSILVLALGAYEKKSAILPSIFIGLSIAFYINLMGWNKSIHYFNEMYIDDNFSIAFNGVLIGATFLLFLFVPLYYKPVKRSLEDIYALILFALAGGLMMTSYGNILMLFLGVETLSISLYILAGSKKFDRKSNEAAMKYFLSGSFASGFLLFGIALMYGATGSFNLAEIQHVVVTNGSHLPVIFTIGLLLIFVGLTFKVGAAPFHFWTPDVYEGSPTIITSFMATVGKVAAIAAFYRLVSSCFGDIESVWQPTLVVFAVLTIAIGNLSALYQESMKRMLAYSGIAHAGYMLLALISIKQQPAGALLLYVVAYAIATLTAFAVLMFVREKRGTFLIRSFNGLGKTHPVEAFVLTVSMFSLAGIPPLIGFSAKFQLFVKAIEAGFLWLVVVALVGTMVSIYYYFRPIVAVYFYSSDDFPVSIQGEGYRKPVLFAAILLILLSIFQGLIVSLL